jgi:2-dehydropantoate 2-reductase
MRIVVFGAGVQGTLFAVRLALGGHEISLVAREARAVQLARSGAIIEDIRSGRRWRAELPVSERLEPNCEAELCLVTVRREQLEAFCLCSPQRRSRDLFFSSIMPTGPSFFTRL